MNPPHHPRGTAPCPSQQELVAFNGGALPTLVLEAIGDHLGVCPRCLAALGGVADEAALGDFRRSLRKPAEEPFATDADYRRMEDRARQLFTTERGGRPRPHDGGPGLTPPFVLGQYQVVQKIGQGGMGSVYRALHTRLKKEVAVKVLPPDRTAGAPAVARFQREMEAVGRLDHPNIVRATDAGEADGVHFLVMELIDGVDLHYLARLCGRLPVADACELARQAAAGLQCVHERGLVHRDLKPSNLLLSVRGELKVLDLGLALLHGAGPAAGDLTRSGQVMGTADYMAPEQWEASHGVDTRADLYSLGCTLYFLLTGRAPFGGPDYCSQPQKMAAHLRAPVPPLRAARPEAPAGLEAVLNRLLAKDPDGRYQRPDELARALEPLAAGADLPGLARRAEALRAQDVFALSGHPTIETQRGRSSQPLLLVPRAGRPWVRLSGRHRLPLGLAAGVVTLAAVWLLALWLSPAARQDRALLPGTSHDLLDRPPTEFLWWNPDHLSRWDHDGRARRVFVHAQETALLGLGNVEAPGFTLQLGILQERWTGGIGVFFAGRRDPASGKLAYQFIQLRKGPGGKGPPFVLHRGRGSAQPRPNLIPLVEERGVASAPLPAPEGREHFLHVEVTRRGLGHVSWDGIQCLKLTDPATRDDPGENYHGEFGLFCEGCSGQLLHARLFLSD